MCLLQAFFTFCSPFFLKGSSLVLWKTIDQTVLFMCLCRTLMQQGWVPHCTQEGKKKLQAGYLLKFRRQPEVLSANQQRLLEFEGEKKHSTQSQAVDGSSGGAKHIAQKPLTHTVRICLIMFVLRNQSHFLVRNFAFLNKKTIPCTDQ